MNSDWLEAVKRKYSRKNQILFDRQSECLQELKRLIAEQRHRTLVMWSFEQAVRCAEVLRARYPDEERPDKAISMCREWAQGEIKMPEAKRAIMAVHAAAKCMDSSSDRALCHAVGQACAAVHVETHAIGAAFYELSAIVFEMGIDDCQEAVGNRIAEYISSLKYWQANIDSAMCSWAGFLLDDTRENKEKLLAEKNKRQSL